MIDASTPKLVHRPFTFCLECFITAKSLSARNIAQIERSLHRHAFV